MKKEKIFQEEKKVMKKKIIAAREQVMICPMVMHPAMIKEFNMNRRSGTVRNALIKLEKVGFLGNMSKEELLELKKAMNAKALAKRRTRTALRVTANVVFAVLILLPLLYAISIALMPSSELFTTELNLFPKNPTFSNFINAFRTVPLLRFILNSFIMADYTGIGRLQYLFAQEKITVMDTAYEADVLVKAPP